MRRNNPWPNRHFALQDFLSKKSIYPSEKRLQSEHLLVDKAFTLNLSAPEMTVLFGGMRVLNANAGASKHGIFTDRPETLTNDFFVNVLDMSTEWKATSDVEQEFEGRDRNSGEQRWTGTRVDLIFGSNSELRSLAEV